MSSPVVGSDGLVPIYNPEDRWCWWSINEIWLGPSYPAANKFVPKVKDYVIDPDSTEIWIVDSIDAITLEPTLRPINLTRKDSALSQRDILFGVGPGAATNTYRAYLNTSVYPHTLTIDTRHRVGGSLNSYAKIFLGVDTSAANGKVISKVYDNSGNLVSTNVPLELIALDSHENYAIKSIKTCHIVEDLPDGEVVTAVIYSDDGHVTWREQFMIVNSDLIADTSQGTRYITDISLESIWLSPTITNQLEYPLNIPMNGLNMMGVVHYSNGDTLRLPVDGGKFAMLGLDGRLSTIVGQPTDLVLRYLMSSSEVGYAANGVQGRKIVKPFKIVTVNPNDSIAVKLFGYPVWQGAAVGYTLRWFLLNMARNVYFEVTPYVKFAENTGPFDPKLYGYLQRKAVTINLRDVSGSFIPFVHTQVVDVVLNQPPSQDTLPSWTVATESSETHPRYGFKTYGIRKTSGLVNFQSEFTTLEDWLAAYYLATIPLVNPSEEVRAPTPTHFIVEYNGVETEWPVTSWDQDLNLAQSTAAGSTAIFRWIRRLPSGDLQLAYSAAIIKTIA